MGTDGGTLAFLAAAALFLGLLLWALARGLLGRRTEAEAPPPARFVPHAFLLGALALGVLLPLAACLLRR